jgi:hypothetical protein
MEPTKENTLYLTIKQSYFNEILQGKKKKEYREIKETTFRKYLETWSEGGNIGLYYNDSLTYSDPMDEIFIYNNGVYPYIPLEYKYLQLAAGYARDRDTMVVKVEDISFEPLKTKEGRDLRFDMTEERFIPNENGKYCLWNIVYHLGEIVDKDLKAER